ncbi:MAG: hypothetical protein AB7E72_01625 [Lysobacterales bacterium]
MNKTLIHALILAALLPAFLEADAKTVHVAIDLSGSNALIGDRNFAYAASQYVAQEITPLRDGDVVRVQTLGARNNPQNLLDATYKISHKIKPAAVAKAITQFIRSLPERPNLAQGATNLLAWIEFHPPFAEGDVILLLSDGIESSELVNGQALAEGKTGLPAPEIDLKGRRLIVYGLGAGLPAPNVRHLRKAWQVWSDQAGAEFLAVIP